jgi:hypothetical protein
LFIGGDLPQGKMAVRRLFGIFAQLDISFKQLCRRLDLIDPAIKADDKKSSSVLLFLSRSNSSASVS